MEISDFLKRNIELQNEQVESEVFFAKVLVLLDFQGILLDKLLINKDFGGYEVSDMIKEMVKELENERNAKKKKEKDDLFLQKHSSQ